MKVKSWVALSLLACGAATAQDYTASIEDNAGINLYTTTSKGVALVKGSPFVPSPVPKGFFTNGKAPQFVAMSPTHAELFAYYWDNYAVTSTLVAFHVTSKGLTQYWQRDLDIGVGGNHGTVPLGLYATPAQAYLVYVPGMSAFQKGVTVYGHDGNYITGYEGAFLDNNGTLENFESIHFDALNQYYYLCLQKENSNTQVTSNYVKVHSYASQIVRTVTNADFYKGLCTN